MLTAIRYPGQLAHLAEIDLSSGKIEKVKNLKGAALYFVTSLAFDHENNNVFYTTNNYGWRDLNLLNLNTGKSELLIKEFRG